MDNISEESNNLDENFDTENDFTENIDDISGNKLNDILESNTENIENELDGLVNLQKEESSINISTNLSESSNLVSVINEIRTDILQLLELIDSLNKKINNNENEILMLKKFYINNLNKNDNNAESLSFNDNATTNSNMDMNKLYEEFDTKLDLFKNEVNENIKNIFNEFDATNKKANIIARGDVTFEKLENSNAKSKQNYLI